MVFGINIDRGEENLWGQGGKGKGGLTKVIGVCKEWLNKKIQLKF